MDVLAELWRTSRMDKMLWKLEAGSEYDVVTLDRESDLARLHHA